MDFGTVVSKLPASARRTTRSASRRLAQRILSSTDDGAPEALTGPEPASGSAADEPVLLAWPLDHFYSPVANSRALAVEPARSRVWPRVPREVVGLDWQEAAQEEIVREHLGRQPEMVFADDPTGDPHEFYTGNEMFSRLDAWMLQGLLRHFAPARMIEVGCGWSSLVSARVNREYLHGGLQLTCIEPYPPDFLQGGVEGISRLISAPVEQVPVDTFTALGDGDVLFIDSSHTVKTGGDVTFLVEEVLPRLAPGVLVHFHDIFLPFDYPTDWVFAGRAWNEQYLVRAFMAFNSAFEVLLSAGWLVHFREDLLAEAIRGYPGTNERGGGSFWIRRS
jgi:hypothetical protein